MKKLTQADYELMEYDDIAHIILTEYGKKMKIQTLFKKVCSLAGLSDKDFEEKIADFFELLSTDKRFIMLSNGYWDLRINHSQKIVVVDDDEEDLITESIEDDPEEIEELEEDDDVEEDDYKDLVVIDPENEELDNL